MSGSRLLFSGVGTQNDDAVGFGELPRNPQSASKRALFEAPPHGGFDVSDVRLTRVELGYLLRIDVEPEDREADLSEPEH